MLPGAQEAGALNNLHHKIVWIVSCNHVHFDQYCCWALKNLALNEANKNRIAGGRGPRLIVEALRGCKEYTARVKGMWRKSIIRPAP